MKYELELLRTLAEAEDDIALNYLDKIDDAMNHLRDFPEPGSIPRYSILKKQGYRVQIVERHR